MYTPAISSKHTTLKRWALVPLVRIKFNKHSKKKTQRTSCARLHSVVCILEISSMRAHLVIKGTLNTTTHTWRKKTPLHYWIHSGSWNNINTKSTRVNYTPPNVRLLMLMMMMMITRQERQCIIFVIASIKNGPTNADYQQQNSSHP